MRSSDLAATVVVTTLGEPVGRLARMVDAIAAQDVDGRIELVLAAPAEDHAALRQATAHYSRGPVRLVENPTGARTTGLNRGLDRATGPFAVRIDARSLVPADYARRCIDRLAADPTVAAVGGHQVPTVARRGSVRERGIARALANRWLLGNAAYRDPGRAGAVDTVYLGVFRTADVRALRYDERLTANEDYELCRRLRATRRTVWLEAGLDVGYEPRSTFAALFAQYRAFGAAKRRMWRLTRSAPGLRQALPIAGVIGLLAAAVLVRPQGVLLGGAAVVGAAVVLVTDQLTQRGPVRLAVRMASLWAQGTIQLGWISGVLLGGGRARAVPSRDGEHPLQRDARLLRRPLVDRDLVDDLAAGE